MTPDQFARERQRIEQIVAARASLERAQERLALIKRHGPGKVWKVPIVLRNTPSIYDPQRVEIDVTIPYGVVEQQAIYAVQAARRALALLGYEGGT